ncbi:hypothetical protein NN3_25780 [Nocardia neocaledoniensis NBRC 108232]|uniref:Uncharacterized protein n=1 Tax=Nocardia neocaledoniensis TaxID=236511 RepID=A0A317NR24_9NOCA|nr:hypothetical protein [Nocardia neocaledoniensis]PWV77750.1 hypothetical protein DFR69_103349 [Nocardia neocaledoniensis]GEM31571.1 hypothetical protein NN3_25780 [Nocardia neocaledoniensis NBRC 108232]
MSITLPTTRRLATTAGAFAAALALAAPHATAGPIIDMLTDTLTVGCTSKIDVVGLDDYVGAQVDFVANGKFFASDTVDLEVTVGGVTVAKATAYYHVETQVEVQLSLLLHATGAPLVTKRVPTVMKIIDAGSGLACDVATGSAGISSD